MLLPQCSLPYLQEFRHLVLPMVMLVTIYQQLLESKHFPTKEHTLEVPERLTR